jgi:hypothetical protein
MRVHLFLFTVTAPREASADASLQAVPPRRNVPGGAAAGCPRAQEPVTLTQRRACNLSEVVTLVSFNCGGGGVEDVGVENERGERARGKVRYGEAVDKAVCLLHVAVVVVVVVDCCCR